MNDQNEKQAIEEMAKTMCMICRPYGHCPNMTPCTMANIEAEKLYNVGYRKQIVGEWTRVEVNGKNYGQVYYQHKECEVNETQLFLSPHHFCPNCGAKMKGGAE